MKDLAAGRREVRASGKIDVAFDDRHCMVFDEQDVRVSADIEDAVRSVA